MANKESTTKYIPLSREEREELKLRISIAIGLSKRWHFSQN
jgi:hypothetical protein